MAIINPAPGNRQRIKTFLTPSIVDFLVTESEDTAYTNLPAYGTAHPDTTNFPNHLFCYAMPADDMGLMYTAVYAMARASQDAYNWEFTKANIGGQKFDAVKRTYVTLRSAFNSTTPTMGTSLANTPVSMFGAAVAAGSFVIGDTYTILIVGSTSFTSIGATANTVGITFVATGSGSGSGTATPALLSAYVLAERQQTRSGDKQLDTIFVIDEQVFVKKVAFTQINYDETFGGILTTTQTLHYSTEVLALSATTTAIYATSLAGTNNDVLWTSAVTGTGGNSTTIAYTTPALATTIATVVGSAVSVAAGTHARMTVTGTLYADALSLNPVNFDKLYAVQGNALALWSSDGGSNIPDSGDWYRIAGASAFGSAGTYTLDKYYNGALVASWTGTSFTYPSAAAWTAVGPASGTPTVTSGISTANQVIAAVAASSPATALLTGVPNTGNNGNGSVTVMSVQSLAGGTTTATSSTAAALFADPANAYWGLQSSGYEREGSQLSATWYAITSRQVIQTSLLTGRTYSTIKDYYWPGVLSSIRTDSWPLISGGTEQYVTPIYSHEAYRGPCKAIVSEVWSSTAPRITDPVIMMPLPIDLACPFFSVNVGPTLHAGASITLTSGTNHPKYEYAGVVLTVVATTPTTWPTFIADPPEVTPFRGGYLKRTVTIYPPAYG